MPSPSATDALARELRALGIGDGDLLLVHSKMGGASLPETTACLEALVVSVAPSGTLAVPTFNFGFCAGKPYDRRKTPSQMGLLTEFARRDKRAKRIHHPIYSFALFGRDAEEHSRKIKNDSAFGDESLFGELRRRNGKILLIDLKIHETFTFLHHVEEMAGCDYRYLKTFTGPIIDEDGRETAGSCKMMVRNLDMGVETDVEPMEKRLESLGLVKEGRLGRWPARVLEAGRVFEAAKDAPRKEPDLLRRMRPHA